MAISKNGANGSLSGKVGSVVFVNTKRGVTIVRSLPRVNKNKKPTAEQALSRSKFRIIQKATSAINYAIRKGFAQYDPNKRACDSAMSYNLQHAVQEENGSYTINWEKFTIAKGFPNPITSFTIDVTDSRTLKLTWEYDDLLEIKYNLRSYNCQLILLDTDETKINNGLINSIDYPLSHKEQDLSIPFTKEVCIYHVYLFFFASDGSNKSTDSMYLGTVES